MVSKNIHSYYCVVELGISRLQNFIISVLFVIKSIESFENKLKHRA